MKRQNRLTSRSETQEQQVSGHDTEQKFPTEFANAEEMLRHDALHTPVPPAIAHRLKESTKSSTSSTTSWWRRFFGGA